MLSLQRLGKKAQKCRSGNIANKLSKRSAYCPRISMYCVLHEYHKRRNAKGTRNGHSHGSHTNSYSIRRPLFPSSSPLPSSGLSIQYYYLLQQTTATMVVNPTIFSIFFIVNLLLLPLYAPRNNNHEEKNRRNHLVYYIRSISPIGHGVFTLK